MAPARPVVRHGAGEAWGVGKSGDRRSATACPFPRLPQEKDRRDSRERVMASGRVQRGAGASDTAVDASLQCGGKTNPSCRQKRGQEKRAKGEPAATSGGTAYHPFPAAAASRSPHTPHPRLARLGRRATRGSPCRAHARRSSTSNAQQPSWGSAIAPPFVLARQRPSLPVAAVLSVRSSPRPRSTDGGSGCPPHRAGGDAPACASPGDAADSAGLLLPRHQAQHHPRPDGRRRHCW